MAKLDMAELERGHARDMAELDEQVEVDFRKPELGTPQTLPMHEPMDEDDGHGDDGDEHGDDGHGDDGGESLEPEAKRVKVEEHGDDGHGDDGHGESSEQQVAKRQIIVQVKTEQVEDDGDDDRRRSGDFHRPFYQQPNVKGLLVMQIKNLAP